MKALPGTLGGLLACSALSFAAPHIATLPEGALVPDAEVDEKGTVHVAYLADGDVYYVNSANEGVTFTKPIRVNTEPGFAFGAAFRGPDLALGKDGRVHVIWYNAGYQQKRPHDEWGVMYARLDGKTKSFEKARNLNRRPSDNFSLAADATGKVAVIWMAGGIFANFSEDGGETFAPPVDLKLDPCECCGSRAVYSAEGALSVLYRDKTDNLRDASIAHLASGSSKWQSREISQTPWPIDSCPMTGGFLGLTNKGLAAAWETKGQTYFAILHRDPIDAKPREIRAAEKGRYPVVLASAKGVTLVAWKDGNNLQWQLFDSEGHPTGPRGSSAGASPHRPAGVLTKSGRFILFP